MPHSSAVAADTVMVAVPRAALTIVERARTASQHTSDRVLGLPSRVYLETIRDFARDGGTVYRAGKARMVDVDTFLAWLASRPKPQSKNAKSNDDVDELAAELGLVAGGK